MRAPGPPSSAAALALAAVLGCVLFLEPEDSWLLDPDESRYAVVAKEMLASGDFVSPTLNGANYLEKPPLLYWAQAASFAAFGKDEDEARLPSKLAVLGTAAMLLFAARGMGPAGTGPWAAVFLLSAPLAFALGRANVTDGLLTLWMTAVFLLLRAFALARERGEPARGILAALGAAAALAVLTKGLVGVVLPGLVFVAWCAILGRRGLLRGVLLSPALPVFLLLAVPWFVLVERAAPGFCRRFFLQEHLLRFATDEASRPGPPYYPAGAFLLGFLPWTVLLPGALRPFLTVRREALRRDPDGLYLAIWVAAVILFFTFSRSKLAPYVLPAFPAAALLAGRRVAAAAAASPAGGRRHLPLLAAAGGMAVLLAVAVVLFPRFSEGRPEHEMATLARGEKPARVVCYRCFSSTFPWVLRRPVAVADERGELGSDGVYPPRLYWGRQEFWRRWDSGERLVAFARGKDIGDFSRPGHRPARVLLERDGAALLANYGPP